MSPVPDCRLDEHHKAEAEAGHQALCSEADVFGTISESPLQLAHLLSQVSLKPSMANSGGEIYSATYSNVCKDHFVPYSFLD